MQLLDWSSSYSVGHQQFDEDHEHLVTVINYLHAAMRCGQHPLIISGALDELWEHSERHFRAEETYMRAIEYPFLAAHKQEHVSLLLEIANLRERYEHGDTHLNTELIQLLLRSIEHIEESDRRCTLYTAAVPLQMVTA
jgi:hemerythrin-like metal-binding protein